jgi:hypothetical protein
MWFPDGHLFLNVLSWRVFLWKVFLCGKIWLQFGTGLSVFVNKFSGLVNVSGRMMALFDGIFRKNSVLQRWVIIEKQWFVKELMPFVKQKALFAKIKVLYKTTC